MDYIRAEAFDDVTVNFICDMGKIIVFKSDWPNFFGSFARFGIRRLNELALYKEIELIQAFHQQGEE